MAFSGDIIDAQEMLQVALGSKVVPDADLMPASLERQIVSQLLHQDRGLS
jgi:enoyl-CoA hydratase/carnithine racemase